MPAKDPDVQAKAFGVATHLALSALLDRLIQSRIISAEEVRIALLQAIQNAETQKIVSPFPEVTAEADCKTAHACRDRGS